MVYFLVTLILCMDPLWMKFSLDLPFFFCLGVFLRDFPDNLSGRRDTSLHCLSPFPFTRLPTDSCSERDPANNELRSGQSIYLMEISLQFFVICLFNFKTFFIFLFLFFLPPYSS